MIREATDSDIKTINSLNNYQITINDFSYVLVYINDGIKGFIDCSIMYDRAEINYLFVDYNYRRQGIASLLLQKLINKCYGLVNITLEVSVNNKSALDLYKKYSFEKVGIRRKYYNGIDAYLMERRII